MKKIFITFLILLSLSFSITHVAFSENIFKQGVYTLSDLNKAPDNLFDVKNVSLKEDVYIAIFDEEYAIMQSIKLSPNSSSYNLIPLNPNHRIVILGKGEVYFSQNISK